MGHPVARLCIVLSLLAAGPAIVRAQSCTDERLRGARDYISRLIQRDSIPSISMGIAINGRLLCTEGFGYADVAARIPSTGRTRYAVASVAKPFVATGIMVLVQQGRVSLDSSANRYLPRHVQMTGHAAEAGSVTLRDLLQHRGGLPSPHVTRFLPEQAPSVADAIRRYAIVVDPPGGRYAYSNLGYGVLAFLSAEVARKRYDRFLHDEIFLPLGLRETTLEIGPRLSRPAGRLYGEDNRPLPYYLFDEWGSGRIWSSARDLIDFGLFHLGLVQHKARRILADSTRSTMVEDHKSTGSATGLYGLDWFYGLGWGGRKPSDAGPMWYGHDGGMPGASANLRLLPERRMVVVVLSNSGRAPTRALTDSIVDALVPEYAAMRRNDPVLTRPRPEPLPFGPPPDLMGRWHGRVATWNGDAELTLSVRPDSTIGVGVGTDTVVKATDAEWQEGRLTFDVDGRLDTPDLRQFPEHRLWFNLTLRGDSLSGAVMTYTPTSLVPSVSLPAWVVLRR